MKELAILLFFIHLATACSSDKDTNPSAKIKSCTYPEGKECGQSEYCIFRDVNESVCTESDDSYPMIAFPLTTPVVCTQPVKSASGRTHSYLNTSYAVDLASPKKLPNAKVRAVFDGLVITSTGCDNNDQAEINDDPCGMGFGNWIIVINEKSQLWAFYAHLRTVKVKDGVAIKAGQILGEEGKSGRAGHRHLHFSLHRNTSKITLNQIRQYGIWLPPSIPYKTSILEGNSGRTIKVEELPCLDNNDLNRKPFLGNPQLIGGTL